MNVLDLFSGIGGFSIGLENAGMTTVAFCEKDKFCQKVLKKHWPDIPIYNDVRNLDYDGSIDIICGGFPCQPFSSAGKRKGTEDDSYLWPAMFRLIQKYKPSWVIGENVAGIVSMALDQVLFDMESEAYTTRAFVIPACALNAPHRRDRVWIVAWNSKGARKTEERKICEGKNSYPVRICKDVADSDSQRQPQSKREQQEGGRWVGNCRERVREQWAIEPELGRVVNGVPDRMDRLKCLGNAVVPQIPEIIGTAIMSIARQ